MGAALCRAQVAAFAGGLDQEAAQRHGVGHKPGECVLAKCADEAVGVVFGGQKQKFDAAGVGGVGQGAVQRLVGRAPPGGVAVEAEHHRIGETKKLLHMVVGAGRAQRGHGVGQAVLGQRHHVHVTLGDQGVTLFAQRATGFKQAVQLAAFAEHGGFGRVQVFGFFVTQHPAAKPDAFPFDVADREHDAVAEAVVALFFTRAVVGVGDDQATLGQQRVVVVGEDAGQAAPAFGRIAQAKLFGDGPRQTPALEVVHGAGGDAQLFAVGLTGFFKHVAQCGVFLALLGGAGLVLGRCAVVGNLHAELLGQILHGLHEGHARVFH